MERGGRDDGVFLAGGTAFSFACPAGGTAQPLGAGCLLAAMPLRDSWCPVGASPPYGWGVPLADKSFSTNQRTFVGADILSARQRNFTNLLFPSAEREAFSVLLVLDSEKEKVDRWKSWGGAVQQDGLPVLRCCSSGERLWGVLPVSGGLGLSDPWFLLRHCR